MLMKKGRIFSGMAALAGPMAIPTSLEGAAHILCSSSYSRLSDAVHAAQAGGEKPHVNSSMVDSINGGRS